MMTNDPMLIKKILAGDRAAMQQLYQLHERHWFRMCLRYGRNRSEAQDILQEGLVAIFRDLGQFDPLKTPLSISLGPEASSGPSEIDVLSLKIS
ncbi:MAG: sigma factor [Bacteroidota bacterium]